MKRIIAVILSITLCCCFSGCGEKKADKDKEKGTVSSKPQDAASKTDTSDEENYDSTIEVNLNFDDYYQLENAEKIDIKDKKVFKCDYMTKTLHAVDITDKPSEVAVTTADGQKILYKISVAKSKINIVIVAGQSNAAGEITGIPEEAKKYTQALCDSATTFMWKEGSAIPGAFKGGGNGDSGKGTGICSALARQWTEQLADSGKNEKVVLVFAKNHTATAGISLEQYMDDNASGANVKKTVAIVNKCYDYYEKGAGSKGYDIASCGMYWFQGEGNASSAAKDYYNKFSTVWNQIKSGTNNRVKYCGIMRVRIKSGGTLAVSNSVLAQFKLANDFDDIYMASTLTESLNKSLNDTVTLDVSNYKVVDETQYTSIVSGNILTEKQGNIYGGLHYSPLGFNILGADAAYNMIRALYSPSDNATLVDANGNRIANVNFGSSANVKLSDLKANLYAYMDVGSSGKAVKISVMSGGSDITSTVTDPDFMLNLSKIKSAENVKIVLTANGKTATFNIVK